MILSCGEEADKSAVEHSKMLKASRKSRFELEGTRTVNSSELDFQQAMKKNFDRVKRDLPEAGHDLLIQKLPLPQTTLSGLTRRGEDLKPKGFTETNRT